MLWGGGGQAFLIVSQFILYIQHQLPCDYSQIISALIDNSIPACAKLLKQTTVLATLYEEIC